MAGLSRAHTVGSNPAAAHQRHSRHGRLLRSRERRRQRRLLQLRAAARPAVGGGGAAAAQVRVWAALRGRGLQHLLEAPAAALVDPAQKLGGEALQRALGRPQRAQRLRESTRRAQSGCISLGATAGSILTSASPFMQANRSATP